MLREYGIRDCNVYPEGRDTMKVIVSIDAAEYIKKKSSDGASVRIAVIQIKSG
jgi:hypothetical protein